MLLTLSLGLLLQGPLPDDPPVPPAGKAWVESGYEPGRPDAQTIAGPIELTRQAAWTAARRRLDEVRTRELETLASRTIEASAAKWLPDPLCRPAVERWARSQLRRQKPRVLDHELKVRSHEFGHSYQAFLLVDLHDRGGERTVRSLRRELDHLIRRVVVKSGGALGWFGVVALLIAWLDRLTRGYMTRRLYGIGAVVGVGVPVLLLLL
ncbi:MAG: hypothetical protein H6837_00770 [Planctomycetes bacterium]|nr:hypothetical protein [Planctomycetota bacterium]